MVIHERVVILAKNQKYVQADIRDIELMRDILKDVDVLHLLAAEVEAEKSIHREKQIWENNFEAPKALVEVCPRSTRIMFASSGNVFGL